MPPLMAHRFPQAYHRMYLSAFLLDFSVAIGLTAVPFFIYERLYGGAGLSGLVGAIQMALYAAGCLLSAAFVSRSRNTLHWALAGVAVFAVLFALAPMVTTPAGCLITTSLPFLGLALAWPAMQTWLGREPDPLVRGRRLAWFNSATAFGFTLSPLLAGPLFDLDFRLPFVALFLVCSAVLVLLLSITQAKTPQHLPPDAQDVSQPDEPVPMTQGLLYASWAATFVANGLVSAVRSVYPMGVMTLAETGMLTLFPGRSGEFFASIGPATLFSWLAFLLSLATVATFAFMGRTRGWQGRFGPLLFGQAAAAVAFILLGTTANFGVMLLCVAAVGVNFGIAFFASIYYSLAQARTRHRYAAINEGVLGAGGFAGAICLGIVAGNAGISVAFQGAPVLILAAIALQAVLLRKFRL